MEKPILVARQDFVKNIFALINGSGLPPFVVEYILRDVLAEVSRAVHEDFHKQEQAFAVAQVSSEQQEKSDD